MPKTQKKCLKTEEIQKTGLRLVVFRQKENQRQLKISNIKKLFKTVESALRCFYTNADQFVNKRDDLTMFIAGDTPGCHFDYRGYSKKKPQVNPITQALLDIDDYKMFVKF